ncbi:MAG TPA: amino acid permease [Coleofasciculaceae cyanobacterium]|jgi:APA family basic amino acid/polyamine antiporter
MSGIAGVKQRSLISRLFRTKDLDKILSDSANAEHQLKKTLTAFDLVIFGVGAMIGAGIFVLTGSAAAGSADHAAAGPALTLSFVLTGLICSFCALCYSEFSAMAPISGSAYTYAFSTMGEFVAWIIGWALVLEYAVGNMAVAVGWTGSIKAFLEGFGIHLPAIFTSNTIDTVTSLDKVDQSILLKAIPFTLPGSDAAQYMLIQQAFNLPAALVVLAVTALLYIGVSESARTAAVMVFMKTSVVLMFIAFGLVFLFGGHMETLNTNWFANGWDTFAPNGWSGILTGASMIFFAYIGFDAVSTAAEETKNPQRDIPIGIIGSLAICTFLYILVTAVITGIVPLNQIDKEAAVVSTMQMMGYPWASALVSIGAIAGLTSVLLVLQMGGTRIFYSIARDGLLPESLSKIHPKFQTPHICTVMVGAFVALGSGLLPINLLAEMCNIGTLGAFLVVCLGVAILRFSDPNRERPFKAPLGLTFPILGMIGCLAVMLGFPDFTGKTPWIGGLPLTTWVVTIGWFLLGMLIYFGYGFWNSKLNQEVDDTLEVEMLG